MSLIPHLRLWVLESCLESRAQVRIALMSLRDRHLPPLTNLQEPVMFPGDFASKTEYEM